MTTSPHDQAAAQRFDERKDIRDQRRLEGPKGIIDFEELARREARKALVHPNDGLALERIIGRSDLLEINFLDLGRKAARPVGRLQVRDIAGRVVEFGTGFLVSPNLLITNNHVLPEAENALRSLVDFDYEDDEQFLPRTPVTFQLQPERFFHTSIELDFTIVAVSPSALDGDRELSSFGYLPLIEKAGKVLIGEYVAIVQHPGGSTKKIALRNNKVIDVFDDYIHYTTDTDPGASGSPVYNDTWQVVAVHHAGVKRRDLSGRILSVDGSVWTPEMGDERIAYVANEGVRVTSILKNLRDLVGLSPERQQLLDELFIVSATSTRDTAAPPAGPIESAERVDEDYVNALGYNPEFLGVRVDLPTLSAALSADAAPRSDGRGVVLDYTHFSLVMSRSRRMALYTAVNIDGKRRKKIARERDRWYYDPRLAREHQAGPDLYARNDLDRGHLVRREDPVWGRAAGRANEDSFHFTNASPQHKHLNQRTWRELEDYVLNNADVHDLKVTVFTGPVFRVDDMVYRGSYQLPAEFWKIVVICREDCTLSATAYLQTQKNLIENLEFAYGAYRTYQVPVTRIETLTGLDFGPLRDHDPAAAGEGTLGRLIGGAADLRL
jgi:endonuclease G